MSTHLLKFSGFHWIFLFARTNGGLLWLSMFLFFQLINWFVLVYIRRYLARGVLRVSNGLHSENSLGFSLLIEYLQHGVVFAQTNIFINHVRGSQLLFKQRPPFAKFAMINTFLFFFIKIFLLEFSESFRQWNLSSAFFCFQYMLFNSGLYHVLILPKYLKVILPKYDYMY